MDLVDKLADSQRGSTAVNSCSSKKLVRCVPLKEVEMSDPSEKDGKARAKRIRRTGVSSSLRQLLRTPTAS